MSASVVLKVVKSETFGREAKVFGEFCDHHGAVMLEYAMNLSALGDVCYIACKKDHIHKVCENISAALITK